MFHFNRECEIVDKLFKINWHVESFSRSLWGVIVGQAIQGVGLGAVLVSAFIQSLQEAM